MPQGLYREAVTHFRKASDLDPLNVFWRSVIAENLTWAGLHAEAEQELRAAFDLDDTLWHLHLVSALRALSQERPDDVLPSAARRVRAGPVGIPLPGGVCRAAVTRRR